MRSVLQDERVVRPVAEVAVAAQVDIDTHPELAQRFNVTTVPNLVIRTTEGVVRSSCGPIPADTVIDWLSGVRASPTSGSHSRRSALPRAGRGTAVDRIRRKRKGHQACAQWPRLLVILEPTT